MKRNNSDLHCTGRQVLALTAAVCLIWLTMDVFLYSFGPSAHGSDDGRRPYGDVAGRRGQRPLSLDDDLVRGQSEASALLFEDLLERERKIRLGTKKSQKRKDRRPRWPTIDNISRIENSLEEQEEEEEHRGKSGSKKDVSQQLASDHDTKFSSNKSKESNKLYSSNRLTGNEVVENKTRTLANEIADAVTINLALLKAGKLEDGEVPQIKNHVFPVPALNGISLNTDEKKPTQNEGGVKSETETGKKDEVRLGEEKRITPGVDGIKPGDKEVANISSLNETKTSDLPDRSVETFNKKIETSMREEGNDVTTSQEKLLNFREENFLEKFLKLLQASNGSRMTSDYVRIREYNVRLLPFDTNGPGENGRSVPSSGFEQKLVKAMWNLSFFNQLVSDKISVERSLPDTRNPSCKEKMYNYSQLPTVSVIICFTEELWSALMRSIYSVLNRTPPELLQEILLIDDFSQRSELKAPIDSYMASYAKVRLIHLSERVGLIRARMIGVREAKGKVIVFLDSHVECNRGWLEPLLEAVHSDRKKIVSPIIDVIDAMDFQYRSAPETNRGGFSWNLQFRWSPIPSYEMERRRGDPTAPIRTPTVAGGLFMVDRDYFQELGEYDPGLDVWGGENLELSFKTWMCGGNMEIIPCSRVGHVFRSGHPYSFPGKMETLRRNVMRVAKVWLDSYVDIVFKYYPQYRDVDTLDVSDRVELRSKLQCQSFAWYLQNVYPEFYVPSASPVASGELRNLETATCMDRGEGGIAQVFPCHGRNGSQFFQLAEDNRLEVFTECIGLFKGTLRAMDCNIKDLVLRFTHATPRTPIVDAASGFCVGLDSTGLKGHQRLLLEPCQMSRLSQKWTFAKYAKNN